MVGSCLGTILFIDSVESYDDTPGNPVSIPKIVLLTCLCRVNGIILFSTSDVR